VFRARILGDHDCRLGQLGRPEIVGRRVDQIARQTDAAGEPLTACDIDLQPGGTFKFVTKGHPEMPFVGTYREITPPDCLVFEAMGALGRVVLRDVAGRTHMTVEIECRSAEQLEQYLKMGVDIGTSQTLDNLVAYVRRRLTAVS
jgi:uncharacterized protein YndB with AHSA1/START domain